MTTQRTRIIGLIVSDVTNTFFAELMRGIEDVLVDNGYSLMLCNTNEVLEREEYYIDILLRQGVDGIIAAATSQDWDALNEAAKLNIPIVMLDRTFENADSPYVGVNNDHGALSRDASFDRTAAIAKSAFCPAFSACQQCVSAWPASNRRWRKPICRCAKTGASTALDD